MLKRFLKKFSEKLVAFSTLGEIRRNTISISMSFILNVYQQKTEKKNIYHAPAAKSCQSLFRIENKLKTC